MYHANKRSPLILAVLMTGFVAGIVHAEPQFSFAIEPDDPVGKSGLRIQSAKDNGVAIEPANIQFVNIAGVPSDASDVEIVVTYRDARGTVHVASPGIFDEGCRASVATTGTDIVCAIVFAE